jgi:transcriptional regulator with XRE-family HTH domain
MVNPHNFSGWLGVSMARANLSQARWAAKVGASTGTVSYWARGKVEPNDENIRRLARALAVPVEPVYEALGRIPPQEDDGLTAGRRILALVRELDPILQEVATEHFARFVAYLQDWPSSRSADASEISHK